MTKTPWKDTPLIESQVLSNAAGCRVFLKLENLQPSESFKLRGIGYYLKCRLAEHPNPRHVHFYASSGGNAGLACVCAAKALSCPATVVVPVTTKPLMMAKIRAAGASNVIQHGANWKEADDYLKEAVLAADLNGVYVPPFNHPDIWTGNSSVITDTARQLGGETPDVVICSVGGGGLFNGIMQGMDQLGWSGVTVLAVETEGAHSLRSSIEAGKLMALPRITSQATSLGCPEVTMQTFEYAQRPNVKSIVLSDAEAAMGCWRLADDERLVVELACGVNVALLYDGRLKQILGRSLNPDTKVVVVLCGGGNVTVDMLAEWKLQFGVATKVMRRDSTVPSEVA